MVKGRFKELGSESFFGDYLYERTTPAEHFLRKLEGVVDWEVFTPKLIRLYRGRAERGRPPYNPVLILKILALSYLYDLSERQVEAYVNGSLSAKWFLGMAVDETAPDHSTLTKFKERIERQGKEALLEELLQEVVMMAVSKAVGFGAIQVVDSRHTLADVNVPKDDRRQDHGQSPRDRGAQWGVKGKRQRKRQGKKERYKIERKFGEAKANHGLRGCRYVGRLRYGAQ